MELDRLLNAVGKQTFIKYYNYFKDLTYNSSDILDIITEDYTDKSKRSRLGHARMIFNEGLNKEALKIIINSNVPEDIRNEAKKILEKETGTIISSTLLTDTQKCLAIELLKLVTNSQLRIEYGELAQKVRRNYNINLNPHTEIPYIIGSISELCFDMNLPLISAVVVNKNTQKPGAGFYDIYDKKHNTHVKGNPIQEDKILKTTKREILECNEWNKLAEYLGVQLENSEEDISQNPILIDNDKIINIIDVEKIEKTERDIISKARIGQSDLRTILLNNKECCAVCGIRTKSILITSHIKPWSKSDKNEKLDSENVLLLCPTHDALFDKGLISFDHNGQIIISDKLDDKEKSLLGLTGKETIEIKTDAKIKYLEYHRKNIFL